MNGITHIARWTTNARINRTQPPRAAPLRRHSGDLLILLLVCIFVRRFSPSARKAVWSTRFLFAIVLPTVSNQQTEVKGGKERTLECLCTISRTFPEQYSYNFTWCPGRSSAKGLSTYKNEENPNDAPKIITATSTLHSTPSSYAFLKSPFFRCALKA